MRKLLIVLFSVSFLVSTLTHQATAKTGDISQSQAIKLVQKRVDGRILKVTNNDKKYKIKVLQKNGRMALIEVDKRSGKLRKLKG